MKTITIVGIVLIVLGAIGLAIQVIPYTSREKLVDVPGIVRVDTEKEKTSPLPLVAGAVGVAAGIVLVVVGSRKR